jgi:hypothetical protein
MHEFHVIEETKPKDKLRLQKTGQNHAQDQITMTVFMFILKYLKTVTLSELSWVFT